MIPVPVIRQYFRENQNVRAFLMWHSGILYEIERDKKDSSAFTVRPPGRWKWCKDAQLVDLSGVKNGFEIDQTVDNAATHQYISDN